MKRAPARPRKKAGLSRKATSPTLPDGRRTTPRRTGRLTFATVRRLALALPAVEEGLSYGTPGFRVAGKFLARLKEDGETLAVRIDFDTRDALMQSDPDTFFITDHYRGYPALLVRLETVGETRLRRLLEEAWRFSAPARLGRTRPGPRSG